jgi:phosphatidylinositol glycan class P protein
MLGDHGFRTATSGFIAWGLSWAALAMYVLWSSVSEETLHRMQFTYYPDRYWAVALPALFVMAFLYYWTTYMLMYLRNTKPLTDMHCLTDDNAKGAKMTLGSLSEVSSSVAPISDIPVSVVSKVLHHAW